MAMYVIVKKSDGRRARKLDGNLSPCFEYPAQAHNYLSRRMGDSKMLAVKRVGKNGYETV